MSRTFVQLGICLAAVCVAFPMAARAEVVDQILATVDKEVVLQSDVMTEIAADLNQLRQQASGDEFSQQAEELLRKGLNQAVEEKILLREAKLAGLAVEEKDIDAQLSDIRNRYESTEAFLKDLETYGITQSDLRDNLRNRVLALRMASIKVQELSRQVVVSESDVAQYYEDHKDEFVRPERVRIRQIFLPVEPGQDPAVARARLDQLKEEIASGADFGELAKVHSKGPAADQGGLIGWVAQGDLVAPLEEAAFALQPGQVSEVISTPEPTPGGFHLIKVEEREAAGQATLDEARPQIEPELRQQAAKERYQKWIDELRKRSRVQIFI